MDARIFARFHLDAGIGDAVIRPLEALECRNWLSFAGIERCRVAAISREQQFAEKLHAYMLPRTSQKSRVKDLVDMALLFCPGDLNNRKLQDALRLTFERRATHLMPVIMPEPPPEWQVPFQSLAGTCGLAPDIGSVFADVRRFCEMVFATRRRRRLCMNEIKPGSP